MRIQDHQQIAGLGSEADALLSKINPEPGRKLSRQLDSSDVEISIAEQPLVVTRWRQASQRIVWPNLAVVVEPDVGDLAHLPTRVEQIDIQHVRTIGTVEPFDERVLIRLPKLNEYHVDAFRFAPSTNAQIVSSAPLLQRIAVGLPWMSTSCSRKRITRRTGTPVATSITTAPRFASSSPFFVAQVKAVVQLQRPSQQADASRG
jgi:hypothetical protein